MAMGIKRKKLEMVALFERETDFVELIVSNCGLELLVKFSDRLGDGGRHGSVGQRRRRAISREFGVLSRRCGDERIGKARCVWCGIR